MADMVIPSEVFLDLTKERAFNQIKEHMNQSFALAGTHTMDAAVRHNAGMAHLSIESHGMFLLIKNYSLAGALQRSGTSPIAVEQGQLKAAMGFPRNIQIEGGTPS